jgi:hypothetical protein
MIVEKPLYARAQDGIVEVLRKAAAAAADVSPALNFEVFENRFRPYIENAKNKAIVNVRIDKIDTDANQTSIHGRVHKVTYNVDMYAKGNSNNDEHEDSVAAERLLWLVAQVEQVIFALKNSNFGLATGEIVRSASDYSCQFYSQDSDESSSVYAPARITFSCFFPYAFKDLEDLKVLDSIEANLLNDWSILLNYEEQNGNNI